MLYFARNLTIENSRELKINYGTFIFNNGYLTIIKGISGIGKTSLLKVLGLVSWNISGESRITLSLGAGNKTENLAHLDWKQKQQLRQTHFAYIFQDDHLIDSISVRDNILFPSLLMNRDISSIRQTLDNMLAEPFLEPIKSKLGDSCSILSGGEKKKVALTRAMLKDPGILIADEPWTNLGGNINEGDVKDYIDFFVRQRKNKSTILATHHSGVITKYKHEPFVKAFELIELDYTRSLRKLELREIA